MWLTRAIARGTDWIVARPDLAGAGYPDRHNAGRRQRHRRWPGGGRPAGTAKAPGDPVWHSRRHRDPHRPWGDRAATAGDHRPAAGRRHSAALGVLEDVP